MATVDIIIVNWNSGEQLRDCLRSIPAAGRQGFDLGRVIVVDNASRDGSAELLGAGGYALEVLRNPRNVGFAAACNQGAAGSTADYLLFLNPDTRLFQNSLSVPISFMESSASQRHGICGIQLLDDAGEVARSCVRFPSPMRLLAHFFGLQHLLPRYFARELMTEWDHQSSRDVDQVMGAFFLVRRAVFESLGGFDERFFVFYEELDFSRRAAASGWTTHFLATAQVFHRGQGTTTSVRPTALFYLLRSRALYSRKHFGVFWASLILLLTLTVEPISRCVFAVVVSGSASDVPMIVEAYARLWRALPRLRIAEGTWP